MSENKNVVFRNAVGGYNKADVNEYIIRQSSELMQREVAAAERVERSEKQLEVALNNNAKLEEKIRELNSLIEEKNSFIENLKSEINTLNSELAEAKLNANEDSCEKMSQQESVIAGQFEEIDSLRDENHSLKEEVASLKEFKEKFDELSKKAALYEKTSANIGEAIIKANKTAEEILCLAKEEARTMREKAQKELDEKRSATEDSARRAMDSIFGKLLLAASENKKDITSVATFIHQSIDKALDDIKTKSDNSAARLKSYEDSIWRSIREDLETINNSGIKRKSGSDQFKRLKK